MEAESKEQSFRSSDGARCALGHRKFGVFQYQVGEDPTRIAAAERRQLKISIQQIREMGVEKYGFPLPKVELAVDFFEGLGTKIPRSPISNASTGCIITPDGFFLALEAMCTIEPANDGEALDVIVFGGNQKVGCSPCRRKFEEGNKDVRSDQCLRESFPLLTANRYPVLHNSQKERNQAEMPRPRIYLFTAMVCSRSLEIYLIQRQYLVNNSVPIGTCAHCNVRFKDVKENWNYCPRCGSPSAYEDIFPAPPYGNDYSEMPAIFQAIEGADWAGHLGNYRKRLEVRERI